MGIHLLDICLACLALYLVTCLIRRRSVAPLPGPTGWPLIGNLLDFPTHPPYKALGAMSAKYGPIISMNIFGTQYVVLNSFEATKDLLARKSAIDRPLLTMASELVGWGNSTGFLQYGTTFRKHRKYLHQQIGSKSSLEPFYPAGEAEMKQFMRDMLRDADNLVAHARRMTTSVIFKISHGYTIEENNDPFVELGNRAMRNVAMLSAPGRFLVDFIPILRYLPEWFPGCGFLKDGKRWRKMVSNAVDAPHQFVLEQLAKGEAVQSFTSKLLQQGIAPEDEEIVKWASFSMFLGGSDTTPTTFTAFFLAMTMYPEILKKAQAEIDGVIGCERLPTIHDRAQLPYVNAICRELLRWNVVVPLATHVTTQDEFYGGYMIPKGAALMGNIWFILSDPRTYPNPDVFDPERYLGQHPQPDPREVCFGWGRRMCPGVHLAETSIFMCVAMALATLDVSGYVENGVEYIRRYEAEEGSVRHLRPFKCRVVSRSKKAEELLQA